MSAVLVDSNVILDVATEDGAWYAWSSAALAKAADEALLVINPLIYAEVSVGFERPSWTSTSVRTPPWPGCGC